MRQKGMRGIKTVFTIASLSLMLLLSLSLMLSYALTQVQENKKNIHWRLRNTTRNGDNFTISTDLFTVRFSGSHDVPKFQFWYNTVDERRTVYQVFFHHLFEFNDSDSDGVFNSTMGDHIESGTMFALPSANVTLMGPNYIINDTTNDIMGVQFNFTLHGKGSPFTDMEVTLRCSLYSETQTITGAEGTIYNITGGAELKIDIFISDWPFKDEDNRLCLWWSINEQNQTLTPALIDNTVTIGGGYFRWIRYATIYNAAGHAEKVPVNCSFTATGKTVNIYMCYPNFKDRRLFHDPSLGVTLPEAPEGARRPEEVEDHSSHVPIDFDSGVAANKSTVFLFQNIALIIESTKDLEFSITVGSDIAMHQMSLVLTPEEFLGVNVTISVSPPSGITVLDNDIDFYLSLEPNESVTFDATLGLYIDEEAIEADVGREIKVSRLTWAYWNGSNWTPVKSLIDAAGYLTANTTHFSIWTVMEIIPLQISTAQLSAETVIQGETVTITITVKDDGNASIPGATVTATMDNTILTLEDQGNGNYKGLLETKDIKPDKYSIILTAQKDGYSLGQDILTLNIQLFNQWMIYVVTGLIVTVVAITAAVILRRR